MKIGLIKSVGTSVVLSSVIIFAGCSFKDVKPQKAEFNECVISGEVGPSWACGSSDNNSFLTAVGSAYKSKLGHGFTNREAVANARSPLAQQVQTEVKDKLEIFMRSTGVKDEEVADKVITQVSKQVAKVTLNGSKQIDYWENNGDDSVYILISINQDSVNQQVKDSVISSFKNDDVLWQQFQAKNALESLSKEFPTK
jgi:LPP20 lipoprotein